MQHDTPICTQTLVLWIKVHEDKVELSVLISHCHQILSASLVPSCGGHPTHEVRVLVSLHGLFILTWSSKTIHKLEQVFFLHCSALFYNIISYCTADD